MIVVPWQSRVCATLIIGNVRLTARKHDRTEHRHEK
jgi:hypothetical protein